VSDHATEGDVADGRAGAKQLVGGRVRERRLCGSRENCKGKSTSYDDSGHHGHHCQPASRPARLPHSYPPSLGNNVIVIGVAHLSFVTYWPRQRDAMTLVPDTSLQTLRK
jgi:hypothetical protein